MPKPYRGIYPHLISCSFHGTFSLLAPNKFLLIKQYKVLRSVKMLRGKRVTVKKRSFKKILNNKGPWMESCGTPVRRVSHLLKLLFNLTACLQFFQIASHEL